MAIQKDIAEHLDISERQVRNLVKEGILPSSKGKGGLNVDECRKAYINYLRGQKTGQVKKSGDDDEAELGDIIGGINVPLQDARKKKLDADTREFKLNILKKDYAPILILSEVVAQLSTQIVASLNTLPMKLKLADPSLKSRSINAAKKEVAMLCNELADYEIDLSAYDSVDQDMD